MYYYVLLLLVLHTMVLLHVTPSGCILGIRYVRTAGAAHGMFPIQHVLHT